jgi:O-antigen/teichoic acid export membrane protein
LSGPGAEVDSPTGFVRVVTGRIARNLSWLVVGDAVVKGGLLAAFALIAHGLGPEGLGLFTVAIGVVLVTVPLFALGQVEVLVREVAARPASARALVASAWRTRRRMLAVAVPLAVAIILTLRDAELRWALLAFLPYTVFRVETFTRSAVFKGLDRMEVEVEARSIELAVALVGTGAVAVAHLPAWTLGLVFSAGALSGLARILRRHRELPGPPAAKPPDARASTALLRHHGWQFLAMSVLFQLLLRSDTLLMEALGLAREEIGRYGAASMTTWAVLAMPQLGALALYPTLSRMAVQRRETRTAATVALLVGTSFGAVAAALLVLFRRPLVDLAFGRDFVPTADLLSTLAWALPGASASMLLGPFLAAWHAQARWLAWLVPTYALSVALALSWIPEHGASGAAWAAVVAHSFGALGNAALALNAGYSGSAKSSLR